MMGIQAGIITIFDKAVKQNEKNEVIKKQQEDYCEVQSCINEAKHELQNAENNFNLVNDPKLIDMYIYKIKYAQTHYEHLLKQIKQMNA